ncbi:hypothetical protein NDU88_002772 [Pleurodeles waltl]|uniref:Uncharacterized protein n=1 Tax=Pleurodeles waltl TaxID=8319 RepID=A0AAV7WM57_PLEWA|nr:hypothetical protein NDU88_002772 [Pleurodeles waltl]
MCRVNIPECMRGDRREMEIPKTVVAYLLMLLSTPVDLPGSVFPGKCRDHGDAGNKLCDPEPGGSRDA